MTYEQAFPNFPILSYELEPLRMVFYHRWFCAGLLLGVRDGESKRFWGVKFSWKFRDDYQEGEPIYEHRVSLGLSSGYKAPVPMWIPEG